MTLLRLVSTGYGVQDNEDHRIQQNDCRTG